ncbi:MAG: phage holin family protein [Myxococcota bacterium]
MTARKRASEAAAAAEERRNQLLAEEAIAEARALIEYELKLARDQTNEALRQARYAALLGAAAVAFAVLALGAITTALVLALGASAVPALVVAALMLFTGAAGAGYTYLVLPHSPLAYARALVKTGLSELRRQLKPHTASPQRG